MMRLQVQGIGKDLGATRALREATLNVEAGEIRAILGESGAGRSTLAEILAGVVRPDAGQMLLDGVRYAPANPRDARKAGVALVCQKPVLAPDLSVFENIVLGNESARGGWLDREHERNLARQVLRDLNAGEIPLDAPSGSLSPAQRQQTEIARSLATNPRLLVLDEPVSALSRTQVQALFAAMCKVSARGGAVLFITNRFEDAREFCHRYTVLRDGRTVAAGTMNCLDRCTALELMAGRPEAQVYPRFSHRTGRTVLRLGASHGSPAPLGADFILHEGEIFGLSGLVGAGRSHLLRMLFGVEPLQHGDLWFRDKRLRRTGGAARLRAGIAILGRDGDEFLPNRSIADNLSLMHLKAISRFGFVSGERLRLSTRDWMEKLHLWAGRPAEEIGHLSRSGRQKVAIGRLLQNRSQVLLLDNPTAGTDRKTRREIHEWIGELASEGRTVVIAGSNVPELLGICDTVGVMRHGSLVSVRPASQWTESEVILTAAAA